MLQVLGRLHPLLVHFPVALLLAALVAECLRPRKTGPSEPGFFCLALGTLGALAAALSGWLFAAHDPPGVPDLLLRHRWSGVGTAAAASATLVSAWRWRKSGAQALARPTRAGLGLTALLAAFSGYLGGAMVYGEGFLLEPLRTTAPLPKNERPRKGGPSSEKGAAPAGVEVARAPQPVGTPPASAASRPSRRAAGAGGMLAPVDYLAEIRPLLERRCYECHGERRRPKGNLKLADLASVLARDPSEAVIVPGDPAASTLYRRLTLPRDHEDVMPPEGEEPLSAEEIELVRRWIAEGARWSASAGAVRASR